MLLSKRIATRSISRFRCTSMASFSTPTTEPQVTVAQHNNSTVLTLNRPKKLNSLTLQMIHELDQGFQQGLANSTKVFLMDGAGPKSFCAGGDVAAVRAAGLGLEGDKSLTRDFFFHEYRLNKKIGDINETIPQVSVWDGITMGGGVGVSIHGKYRVVTEKTLFAKPETAIGLFPDVGASHFLAEMSGSTGEYIALTGARLKANDLMYSGLGTHYIDSQLLESMYDDLSSVHTPEDVRHVLDAHQSKSNPIDVNNGTFGQHRDVIDQVFSNTSMEDIVAALKQVASTSSNSDTVSFCQETLKQLNSMSPTSLKITLEQVRRAKRTNFISLGDCLKMEYRMCQALMKNTKSDFYEGIRAVLVDKDRNPSWNPPTLEEVSQSEVDRHFINLSEEEELHFN